jgi:hypothetical protein
VTARLDRVKTPVVKPRNSYDHLEELVAALQR